MMRKSVDHPRGIVPMACWRPWALALVIGIGGAAMAPADSQADSVTADAQRPPASGEEGSEDLAEISAALAETRSEMREYRRALEDENPRAEEIQTEIRELTQRINALAGELRQLLDEDETWAQFTAREQELATQLRRLSREHRERRQRGEQAQADEE